MAGAEGQPLERPKTLEALVIDGLGSGSDVPASKGEPTVRMNHSLSAPVLRSAAEAKPGGRRSLEFASGTRRMVPQPSEASNRLPERPPSVFRRSRRSWSDWVLGTNSGQVFALICIAFLLVFLGAACWSVSGGSPAIDIGTDLESSLWMSWGLFFDPGTQTGLMPTDPRTARLTAVIFSCFGFVYMLVFLGLTVEKIHGILSHFRQVRGKVVANGHVLVLGWGDKTLFLLCELLSCQVKQCENAEQLGSGTRLERCRRFCRRRAPGREIVVLAQRPVLEMSQQVCVHLEFQGFTCPPYAYLDAWHRISYREGDPADVTQLRKVSAASATDILIMGNSCCNEADQDVIRILLALAAQNAQASLAPEVDVFAEMRSHEHLNIVEDLLPVADGIVARHAVNRMLCLRGLVKNVGFCYMDLVSFKAHNSEAGNNELYLQDIPPEFVGLRLADVGILYPDAVVCGVRAKDPRYDAYSGLVPGADALERRLLQTDQLVILARSLSDAKKHIPSTRCHEFSSKPEAWTPSEATDSVVRSLSLGPRDDLPKVVILIGCPVDFPDFLYIIDGYVAAGSEVHILSESPMGWRHGVLHEFYVPMDTRQESGTGFENITVHHHVGSSLSRKHLAALPLARADCVLILGESLEKTEPPSAVDSRSLTTVVLLRCLSNDLDDIEQGSGLHQRCKVVTEILDHKTEIVLRDTPSLRRHCSYFYSNSMETAVFAMAAQEKFIYEVVMQLLTPKSGFGDIVAFPAAAFADDSEDVSFWELRRRVASTCGGVLLGWRRGGKQQKIFYPELNPRKKSLPLAWNSEREDELLIIRPNLTPSYLVANGIDTEESPAGVDADPPAPPTIRAAVEVSAASGNLSGTSLRPSAEVSGSAAAPAGTANAPASEVLHAPKDASGSTLCNGGGCGEHLDASRALAPPTDHNIALPTQTSPLLSCNGRENLEPPGCCESPAPSSLS
eukprot:TRINITY_DN16370_c0_g3_i1.p1 TRINITY_DN16370_c0_g3~~TRINITY_DN16370_c0_g3_i1.p1  ORF type:complete len:959 (-),score=134.41 TRINITY_DN16370_c0_g3_i1:438-3314(-)